MKSHIVNGYVLPKLFYELVFTEEHFGDVDDGSWGDDEFVDDVFRRLVLPRYLAFSDKKKKLARDTLRYLLAHETSESDVWDVVWGVSGLSIPTPKGVRHFVKRCHDVLFENEPLPSVDELSQYQVRHDMASPDLLR